MIARMPSGTRVRCPQHGLLYDPRSSRGCVRCGAGSAAPRLRASALRVALALCAILGALLLAWQTTPLAAYLRSWARGPAASAASAGELDPALWSAALQYWEPFAFDEQDAARMRAVGIDVYVPRDNLADILGRVTGRRPNRSDVSALLRALNSVLLRYPERFLHETRLAHCVLLCDLVKDGARTSAFVIPPVQTVVIDACGFSPDIFHHELFHLVDYRLHGTAEQPAWSALDPNGAHYIGAARYAQLSLAQLESAPAHFVSAYAQVSPTEDRAETFREWMSDPKRMQQSAAADSVIAAKARYILAELDQLASGSSIALGLRTLP
jgi:hypothetical protein